MKPYTKPALSVADQVALLQSRGMHIADTRKAEHYLLHLNYYRLSGYWIPFEASRNPHCFEPGTCFDDVLNLYSFDRELRLLLLDAIERVEVSLRTQWAYQCAQHAGAHAYLNRQLSKSSKGWARQLARVEASTRDSSEAFITHYRREYSEPDLPPIWSVCEVLSLGELSRWYKLLRPIRLRSQIAESYGLDQQVVESLLHHLTYIRNLCAHHSRVWNRELTVTVELPKTKPATLASSVVKPGNRKIYNTLTYLKHLMDQIAPGHSWHNRLQDTIARHSINTADMGFRPDWQSTDIWQ